MGSGPVSSAVPRVPASAARGTFASPRRSLHGEPGPGDAVTVPHGITLWGRLFEEDALVRVGRALEQALGVWDLRPPIG